MVQHCDWGSSVNKFDFGGGLKVLGNSCGEHFGWDRWFSVLYIGCNSKQIILFKELTNERINQQKIKIRSIFILNVRQQNVILLSWLTIIQRHLRKSGRRRNRKSTRNLTLNPAVLSLLTGVAWEVGVVGRAEEVDNPLEVLPTNRRKSPV